MLIVTPLSAGASAHVQKAGPQLSGFYTFSNPPASEFGLGNVQNFSCTTGLSTQPAIYSGNMLVDCDSEVPHYETSIAVDPANSNHTVAAYNSIQLTTIASKVVAQLIAPTSVTFDGGTTWREVFPPIVPYGTTGDPAIAYDASGHIYFASMASQEGYAATAVLPDIVVARSDDGGLTYSKHVSLASGKGGVGGPSIFLDKPYLTADTSSASPFENRVYVTWTSFYEISPRGFAGPLVFVRSPIMEAHSADGVNWSAPKEISGFNSACSVQSDGLANECDEDQFSVPTVAPDGTVYVAFENSNTAAENQYMVVKSTDGGTTWSNPVRVGAVFDINYPVDPLTGRKILTGCRFRMNADGNAAADPSDPTGQTLYLAWADNRNGGPTSSGPTNTDVTVARSTNGGATWSAQTYTQLNDQFFPWISIAPGGRADVGYMDRQYSAGQGECKYGFSLTRITSFPGVTTTTRLDTGLSDPGHSRWFSGATGDQSLFIGDYNGTAVGPNGSTWSLWTDLRNVVSNPPSADRNHGEHVVAVRTP